MPTPTRRTLPSALWPQRWSLLDSPPASALDNMATDLALLRCAASSGRAVLRLYAWEQPTVSFGRHEAVNGVWDVHAMLAAGLQVVRRPTGGRALLHAASSANPKVHDHPHADARPDARVHPGATAGALPQKDAPPRWQATDVTYSVTLPLGAETPWRAVYDAINVVLLAALQSLGAPVSLSEAGTAISPNGAICFTGPADGEIMLARRKIAGSAVWRANGAYLQHGSILLRNAQRSLERFRVPPPEDALPDEPSHSQTSTRPDADDKPWSDAASVAEAIRDTWRAQSRDIRTFEPSPEDTTARAIARRELSAPDWLWRR